MYIDDLKQFSYRPKQLELYFELRKLRQHIDSETRAVWPS